MSTIPVVGPTIAEVFASFVVPPLERRRNEWMEDIVERLYELEKGQQVNFDNLRDNPEFLDTLLKASREAICTGNIDKRQALRNAVLNSAMPCPPSAAKQTMFLSWVGEMTEWHIRLLDLFVDPQVWFTNHQRSSPSFFTMGHLSGVVEAAYPELKPEQDFYTQVAKDLSQKGLANIADLTTVMTASGAMSGRLTRLGIEFHDFISSPK